MPINYTVSDAASAPENIQKSVLLDGVAAESLQMDLSLQKLGEHTLKITAADEAGNQGEKALIKLLNKEIEGMAELIRGKFAGTIKAPAGELLAESLNFIKK